MDRQSNYLKQAMYGNAVRLWGYGRFMYCCIGKSTSKLVHATNRLMEPTGSLGLDANFKSAIGNRSLVYANGEYVGVALAQSGTVKRVVHTRVSSVVRGRLAWKSSMKIQFTQYGPDADELEFVGSIPAGTKTSTPGAMLSGKWLKQVISIPLWWTEKQ